MLMRFVRDGKLGRGEVDSWWDDEIVGGGGDCERVQTSFRG